MREVKCILLDDKDLTSNDESIPHFRRMTPEALSACVDAPVVIHNGRLVKNRHGTIAPPSTPPVQG